ncbi:unnamed protein product, partial [Symbiodinium sp. CCMP2456]
LPCGRAPSGRAEGLLLLLLAFQGLQGRRLEARTEALRRDYYDARGPDRHLRSLPWRGHCGSLRIHTDLQGRCAVFG